MEQQQQQRSESQHHGPLLMAPDGTLSAAPVPQALDTTEEDSMQVAGGQAGDAPAAGGRRELWGGALSCSLPSSFENASEIRQVPDTQEVFVDKDSDISIILELLELQRDVTATVGGSARYFFQDLVEHNEARNSSVDMEADVTTSVAPHLVQFQKMALIGTQTVQKFRTPGAPFDTVRMYLVNIRLESVGTDLLVTMNVPPSAQAGNATLSPDVFVRGGPRQDPGVSALQTLLHTLRVKDWSLFA